MLHVGTGMFAPEIGLGAYVAKPVPRRTLDAAAGSADGSRPRPGNVRTHAEVDMAVLIAATLSV